MFCSKCGTKLDDSTKFCPNCGANVSSEETTTGYQSLADYTLAEIKQFAKLPLVIAASAVFTLGILLSFQSSPLSWLAPVLSGITESAEIEYLVSMISQYIGASNALIGIITNLPNILIALGMWLLIVSAFNNSNTRLSTGGLTLIKVIIVIQFIISLIIPVLLPILMILTMGELFDGSSLLVVVAIFAVIIAAFILYYTKLLRTINNIRYAADTGTPVVEISGFIIFCCIAGGIVSALFSILNIVGMFNAVAMILFGVVLNKYKKMMLYIRDNGRQHIAVSDSENI